MPKRPAPFVLLAVSFVPLLVASQTPSANEPTCDQAFKNIESFKGVPAKDLIPSMEFMAASLKVECTRCHNESDYSAPTPGKQTARRMIAMVRDINQRFFNGRQSVTCMSCHNGKEHPSAVPLPEATTLRHRRIDSAPQPEDLLAKHLRSVGPDPLAIKLVGTGLPPFGPAEKKGEPVEMVQAADGRFEVSAGTSKFGSDGSQVWRDGAVLVDEPAAIFARMGRSWRGAHAFDGLQNLSTVGAETLGKSQTTVVRGTRAVTGAMEELYFDNGTGLLDRFVNVTHSSLGNVVTTYDYSQYKSVKGTKVPMSVVITFAGGETWAMKFKSASVLDKVDDNAFTLPRKG